MSRRHTFLARLCLATLLIWCSPGQAQSPTLYGYVDGAGVAHLSYQRPDARYQPVLRERGDETGQVPGKAHHRSTLLTWLEFAPEVKALQPVLRKAEQATGVDAELLKAIITVESGYQRNLVSPAGAIGLMQITPDTGLRYATKAELAARPVDEHLRNPSLNVMTGARMLADLTRRYGSIAVALAAWNAGEGTVRKAGGKLPRIAETQAHVHMVLELYWALLQQRQQSRARELTLVRQDAPPSVALR
ncbi:MAG: transglycosylase SLT domain-containing protein [Vitreoscilla sp.]|nr:transglycosylase SLT domain-containing protein [Vitreoscilla sp.]MBP6673979.1 transglycosylase SLT domain-containing protein [Vitreoscilla sp.]